MQRIFKAAAILVFFANCQTSRHINSATMALNNHKFLDSILLANASRLSPVLQNPAEYRLQIIYTQIDRDAQNLPVFTDHTYQLNADQYFYPASTVKMPAALLALEKLNRLGIDKFTPMYTDSLENISPAVTADSSAADLQPSIAHYIKKIFLVSDNDAFNRLYEFIGQEEFNRALWQKGYTSARIRHRLSVPLSLQANRITNAVRFEKDGKIIYQQPVQTSNLEFPARKDFAGKTHYADGQLVPTPFDFSGKNRLAMEDLHNILKSIIFPETVTSGHAFRLKEEDYRFLYRYMSQQPAETSYPAYDTTEFNRNYVKFLLGGASAATGLPSGVKIFNKPGWAYGFLTDVAYIVDFDHEVEFLLSATLYVNADGVIGDDKYDFDAVGKPFLQQLGQVIYETELKREKKYKPDLQRYKTVYDK